ncbi:CD180 antigen [Sorex araneus]|uniref:CD180 antigen n=1 Tax=Sorex araneus TaxID=42254 RepID=UPI0024335C51|nr:CD180 antigen [Sorex araneus]
MKALQLHLTKEVNKSYNCENLGLREIPDTLPNTTEILEFGFNFLPAIENTTFSRLINLVFLDLARCQINWVHEDTFQNHLQLNTIVLTGNPLIFMADTSLNGPQALRHLFLIQTGITDLEFIPAQNLKNLESLYLGSNHIASIKLPTNFPTRHLKVLEFENNAIHYLSREDLGALAQVRNLSLDFSGNDITGIEPGAFRSNTFQSLKFGGALNLSVILNGLLNSTVQSLWLGTFEDIDDQDITPDMLEGLCGMSVHSLSLQKHSFSNVSPAMFRCFRGVQELDLTHTYLRELPAGIEGMTSLKKLVLNANRFPELCQIRASSFPSLTDLSVKGNLEKLDLGVGCLKTLEHLEKLDLSHSLVEAQECCILQFKTLPNLQFLNLSYNQALGLQHQAFEECPRLQSLDLAFTKLHAEASQSPFQNLHYLRVLNLSHCLLDTNNQNLLAGIANLQYINLEGNQFPDGNLPQTNLLQTLGSLKTLVLASCDLFSIDQQAFHPLEKLGHVDLSHNSLTGSSISAFGHLQGLYLNLESNNMDILPEQVLPILSQQSTINLSHNPLDCTCANIHFITWYKENLRKLEGLEETKCANPPAQRGQKLSEVELSCGMTKVGVIFLILLVLLLIVVVSFSFKHILRWRYQHI